MEEITNETMNTVIKTNPQLFMQFSIIMFAVIIVLVIIFAYFKFIKPAIEEYEKKANSPCMRECVYKNDFIKRTEDLNGLSKTIKEGNEALKDMTNKIENNSNENRESFAHIIRMAEKQNDVLVELSTQAKLHTQMLLKNKE